jgi:outer membrane protein OmpA-like peptidoglycan-associated protein
VSDDADACPDQAGAASADAATNGCPPAPPPPDRDHDGVLDADDACPDAAGLASQDRARNGCPAPADTDGDGVLDSADACPSDAGPMDSDPQRNGCPKAFVLGGQIKILDQVKFQPNKAAIAPGQESEDVLLAVVQVLTAHPEIKVRIQGHTDSRGAAALNRELSKSRAQAVLSWLASHGIDVARLTSEGFGPDKPIDSNETEAGRHNNRRVEFLIEGELTQ